MQSISDILGSSNDFGLPKSFKYNKKTVVNDLETQQFSEKLDMEFSYAPISDPGSFTYQLKNSEGPEKKLMDVNKGTTCLGFRFKEGVLIAVDSRASQGTFNASETVRKVIEINSELIGTMAGGAADCLFWENYLAMEARLYELKHGEKISVAGASRIFTNIMYKYRNNGLSIGCMLAGWDKTGPNLFYIDNDGTRVSGNVFSVGSGSTYAYGVLDTGYKFDLTREEAINLGIKAIEAATYRDAGSGGVVRVYCVHQDGWTKEREAEDVNKLHYQFANEQGLLGDGDEIKGRIL